MQKLKSKYGVLKSSVRPTTCVFSDKMGIFDLGKSEGDETLSLEEIHNRISRMRVVDDLDIGIINLNGKSLDPDAMEVLADMLSRMDNIHTAQLRNITMVETQRLEKAQNHAKFLFQRWNPNAYDLLILAQTCLVLLPEKFGVHF